jgi:hypothetical protein
VGDRNNKRRIRSPPRDSSTPYIQEYIAPPPPPPPHSLQLSNQQGKFISEIFELDVSTLPLEPKLLNTIFTLKSVYTYSRLLAKGNLPFPTNFDQLKETAAVYYRERLGTLAIFKQDSKRHRETRKTLTLQERVQRHIGHNHLWCPNPIIGYQGPDAQQQQALIGGLLGYLQQQGILAPPPQQQQQVGIAAAQEASSSSSISQADLHQALRHLFQGLQEIQKNTERTAALLPDCLVAVDKLAEGLTGTKARDQFPKKEHSRR